MGFSRQLFSPTHAGEGRMVCSVGYMVIGPKTGHLHLIKWPKLNPSAVSHLHWRDSRYPECDIRMSDEGARQ